MPEDSHAFAAVTEYAEAVGILRKDDALDADAIGPLRHAHHADRVHSRPRGRLAEDTDGVRVKGERFALNTGRAAVGGGMPAETPVPNMLCPETPVAPPPKAWPSTPTAPGSLDAVSPSTPGAAPLVFVCLPTTPVPAPVSPKTPTPEPWWKPQTPKPFALVPELIPRTLLSGRRVSRR